MTLVSFTRTALAVALAAVCAAPVAARKLPSFDAQAAGASADVPRFLWAKDAAAAIAASPQPRVATDDDEARARSHLRSVASLYRLSAAEIAALPLRNVQRFPGGGALVKLGNRVDGIEVFREDVSVITNAKGDLVAIGGAVAGTPLAARKSVDASDLGQASAIGAALADHGFDASAAGAASLVKEEGGYRWLAMPASTAAMDGSSLAAPLRVKRVWYRLKQDLVPAWYVEVQVREGIARGDVDGYAYVVSAVDGAILFRNDLTNDAAFTYRVYAESTPPYLPLPGPAGRGGFPHPTGKPDGFQPPFVAPSLVTIESAPFSRNDPWLAASANKTTGNNVEAFTNMIAPDGFGQSASDECNLSLPVDGDMHACTTAPSTFDHTYDHGLVPNANRSQAAAAVTNLFYTVNYLHDWFYDAGFDEASGNAQTNNYSRGGLGNDSIFAEAQDFTGTNNANMFTPPDGQRPRMRMFFWTSGVSIVKVESPAEIAGVKTSNTAEFGAQAFDLTAELALAKDAANSTGPTDGDGCTALTNAAAVAGKIAVIDRGTCLFAEKAKIAQNAGAVGVVIVNNVSPGAPGMAGDDATVTIPVVSVSLDDGAAIKARLAQGTSVLLRMGRQATLPRDGALDNTVIAHEWGHYLSNRLVKDANGLVANHARGMGEGWADFVSLLLLVKESDRSIASNANFNGTYPETPYPMAGPDYAPDVLNDAYYYGIRRYPYTRDMSKNPLTFKHIVSGQALPATPAPSPRGGSSDNAEVHNMGEVWASMLWECYSNLLNDTGRLTFSQAQDRMKRYLVAGFKATPTDPTFVDGRDALLAVMAAQDAQDHDLCLAGFAKRGLGLGAVAPNNLSEDNVGAVESFRATAADPGVKVTAVEFYHAGFDHYFVSYNPDEIKLLDNGTLVGWTRTGESFGVYSDNPAGSSIVCRFFSTAFGTKSSHFYTADASECATVKANPSWQLEGEVFSIPRPDVAGTCPASTAPVYRLYNNGQGGAPNHRYTTSAATRAAMLAKGWISEGYGAQGVIMCAP